MWGIIYRARWQEALFPLLKCRTKSFLDHFFCWFYLRFSTTTYIQTISTMLVKACNLQLENMPGNVCAWTAIIKTKFSPWGSSVNPFVHINMVDLSYISMCQCLETVYYHFWDGNEKISISLCFYSLMLGEKWTGLYGLP